MHRQFFLCSREGIKSEVGWARRDPKLDASLEKADGRSNVTTALRVHSLQGREKPKLWEGVNITERKKAFRLDICLCLQPAGYVLSDN